MRHLIKIDYDCHQVKTGGYWFVIDSEKVPELGVINSEPFAGGPMPGHECKNYYYSDNCDMDSSCNWQIIEEIKPYSEEDAKALHAKTLETLCEKPIGVVD